MKKIIIFHGTKGSPDGNWFPWLKEELASLGYEIYVPKLPTPENQTVKNWLTALDDQIPAIDEDTVLIGHSCGATFILHVLETLKKSVTQSILVSPVLKDCSIPEYNDLNSTFIHHNFNWEKIRTHMGKTHVIHGDNDPYVPIEQALEISKNMNTELELIPNGGHLNAETGYTSFPKLIELISN